MLWSYKYVLEATAWLKAPQLVVLDEDVIVVGYSVVVLVKVLEFVCACAGGGAVVGGGGSLTGSLL